ncbi:hypothetical protein P154DRAFT_538253 [Amniculicola lignicola CBS 123094]|uniref:Uncharacterized protein n=1 Tax=Amniculicola lignicola CBS 123094 TaxID=1392246 RepID=A0A6A5W7M6_9PLEO|nr:hypothetical protein P154DRAFT_538253 [Amniculicola lignicola CBS 123094]
MDLLNNREEYCHRAIRVLTDLGTMPEADFCNLVGRIFSDLPTLVYMSYEVPLLVPDIGNVAFSSYEAAQGGNLAMFTRAIHENRRLAKYVEEINFNIEFDNQTDSGVLEMLLLVARRNSKTRSRELLEIAQDFQLLSFDDTKGVPEDMYFTCLSLLLAKCRNVKTVRIPLEWVGKFQPWKLWPKLKYVEYTIPVPEIKKKEEEGAIKKKKKNRRKKKKAGNTEEWGEASLDGLRRSVGAL